VVDDYLALEESEDHYERYDLIWSASLLSMVDPRQMDACIAALLRMLQPGGVLVAAYHGRDSARRFSEHPDEGLRSLAQAVTARGVGFRPRDNTDSLGTTAMTAQWLVPRITHDRQSMLLMLTERGWADHLDVVALARRDIHHPQVNPA
jgi:hypothetical protein